MQGNGIRECSVEESNIEEYGIKEYRAGQITIRVLSLRELTDADFERMYMLCGSERKEKVDKIKAEGKKKQSVGAGFLLSLLQKEFGIKEEPVILPEGKPVFESRSDVQFSISHSGDYAALAFGKNPLGVDIECQRRINLKVAKRFFSKEEYDYLSGAEGKEQEDAFCRIWTGKEAVVKAAGCGLSCPLHAFSVLQETVTLFGKQYALYRHKCAPNGRDLWICAAQIIA